MYVCTYSHTLRKKLQLKYPTQRFCRRQNQGPRLSAQQRPCSPFVEPLTHEGELHVFTLNNSIFSPLMPYTYDNFVIFSALLFFPFID